MAGDIVVWFLVGGVVLLVGRRFKKILAGEGGGCGCGSGACKLPRPCNQSELITLECKKTLVSVGVDALQDGHKDLPPKGEK